MNGHFSKYSDAYLRGILYAIIAFLTAFCAEYDPLKELTPDQLGKLTWVFWTLTWAKILGATAVTMRAFFDGTVERIKQEYVEEDPSVPSPTAAPEVRQN